MSDPQTLNLYSYVRNNPVARIDADGHFATSITSSTGGKCADGTDDCQQQSTKQEQSEASTKQVSVQQQRTEKLAERLVMAGEAAVNAEVAKAKIAAAAVLGAAAPESDGASAIPAALLGISASGNIAAAGVQTVGAITGKTDEAELATKVVTVATSPTGMTTLIASHGNLQKAARWAAVEGGGYCKPQGTIPWLCG